MQGRAKNDNDDSWTVVGITWMWTAWLLALFMPDISDNTCDNVRHAPLQCCNNLVNLVLVQAHLAKMLLFFLNLYETFTRPCT